MHWLAELDGRRLTVEIPATSANLGAGYDCLGLALDLYDRIELEVRGWSRGAIELAVDGEGAGELPDDRDNRFVRGLEAALIEARGPLPEGVGWRIEMQNRIPIARGLGSSAAATVGGLVAGNALAGEPLTNADMLRLATGIEGHPDNAAAALLGGFTVAADSTASSRPCASTLRVTSAPSCSSPIAACRRRTCARPCRPRCRSPMP